MLVVGPCERGGDLEVALFREKALDPKSSSCEEDF